MISLPVKQWLSSITTSFSKTGVSGFLMTYNVVWRPDAPRQNGNYIYIGMFGNSLSIKLPMWIKPFKVDRDNKESLTLGACYGIRYSGSNVVLYYGVQNEFDHSGVKEKRKNFFLPWKQLRTTKLQLFTMDDELYYDHSIARNNFNDYIEKEKTVPKLLTLANDNDGELIAVTSYVELHEYKRGRDGFEWLGYIYPTLSTKALFLKFDKEVGTQKGSWKGGTTGVKIELLPNEKPKEALERFFQNPSSFSREIISLKRTTAHEVFKS